MFEERFFLRFCAPRDCECLFIADKNPSKYSLVHRETLTYG